MSLRPAVERSRGVRLVSRARDRVAPRFEPLTRRIATIERALMRVVRGSALHGWLTADPDPEPVVIDLRETYTMGPVLAVLNRLASLTPDSKPATTAGALTGRVAAAPVRALGLVWSLAFAASLLATVADGGLTAPVYGFHALGLLAGLVMLRERRDPEALAETPIWGTLLAVFAPPPTPREDPDDDR